MVIHGGETKMKIRIFDDQLAMAKAAADRAIEVIRLAMSERGQARIVASAGESQVDFLRELIVHRGVDWAKVEMFCIGEYIGLPANHPASMRRFRARSPRSIRPIRRSSRKTSR